MCAYFRYLINLFGHLKSNNSVKHYIYTLYSVTGLGDRFNNGNGHNNGGGEDDDAMDQDDFQN